MNLKTLIFTGRSGCGKSTQLKKVIELINEKDGRELFHLESGQKFRSFIQGNSYASTLSKKVSEGGGLQPEFLSIWVWAGEIIDNLKPDMHMVIDGTPRRLWEAKVLESACDFFEREGVEIVYLNVSKEWATEKMLARKRADDLEMSDIQKRLEWFDTDVVPAIEYYKNNPKYKVHEINGEQEIDQVFESIVSNLNL